jgi:hypothetical protein
MAQSLNRPMTQSPNGSILQCLPRNRQPRTRRPIGFDVTDILRSLGVGEVAIGDAGYAPAR